MNTVRKEHKDTLFQVLFGAEEHKGNLLSLFNALNGTQYRDESALEINTIGDAIYMGMKNDVSCILEGYLSLHEHQSTFNPNMPLRGLMYFGKLYDKYIKLNKKNIYSSSIVKIPTPKYFVLYNGNQDFPDMKLLRLSDAFMQADGSGAFEWTAVMLNVNSGHNAELMHACPVLEEYSTFVDKVRFFRAEGHSIEEAVKRAVDSCIDEGILRSYFIAHKAEVIGMCITEYNEAETMQMFKEEGRAEGRREGRAEGRKEGRAEGRKEGRVEGRAEGRREVFKEVLELGIDLEALIAEKKAQR